jgi:iron complex transport system ATP-binding protein
MLNLVEQVSDKVHAEASALLEDFGCGYLAEAYWGTLSQGEKQKVLICRALMAKYHLLILDEPCAGLDPVAREVFLRWLATLAAKKSAPSMIMVTHHVEEILPCISHVLVLQSGRVVASGKKEEVLTSAYLTEAYGAPVELTCEGERYRLSVPSP